MQGSTSNRAAKMAVNFQDNMDSWEPPNCRRGHSNPFSTWAGHLQVHVQSAHLRGLRRWHSWSFEQFELLWRSGVCSKLDAARFEMHLCISVFVEIHQYGSGHGRPPRAHVSTVSKIAAQVLDWLLRGRGPPLCVPEWQETRAVHSFRRSTHSCGLARNLRKANALAACSLHLLASHHAALCCGARSFVFCVSHPVQKVAGPFPCWPHNSASGFRAT